MGLLDTGPRAFFLLIAVQRFAAGDLWKTLVTIPGAAGMTLSVLLVPVLARLQVRKSVLLAASRALSGLCFFAAAAFPTLEAYVFWVFLASPARPPSPIPCSPPCTTRTTPAGCGASSSPGRRW